jgi:hypothetical protein
MNVREGISDQNSTNLEFMNKEADEVHEINQF